VTVTGPGGVGQTRVAERVARLTAGRFADGVWLAELASGSDPALVPAVVCSALAVYQVPGAAVTDALVTALSRKRPKPSRPAPAPWPWTARRETCTSSALTSSRWRSWTCWPTGYRMTGCRRRADLTRLALQVGLV
jgi:hypothetical protein